MMDSDSDEDNAYFGTPLEELEVENAARRRPPAPEDQAVRDSKGRQRFHGAFTGGFSAGFFNTVGSQDGFMPATFVSSRTARAEKAAARPNDFMDDEDRGEHGIAPQRVQAKTEFREPPTDGSKRKRPQFNEGPIPGEPVLEQLIKPVRETVGVRILKSMGWRPGQGVGPRITRKEKKQTQKIYGCAPPPDGAGSGSDSDDSDSALRDVLLAPDDTDAPLVRPKDDRFGLGYRGLDRRSVLGGPAAGDSTLRYRDSKGKLAIRGQAFGVGAFEEEDADIYATEDMSNYDFEDTPETSKRRKPQPATLPTLCRVLEGFHLASVKQPARARYPPPPLPPGYRPEHKARVSRFQPVPEERRGLERHKLSAVQRSQMIGEEVPADSGDPSGGGEKQATVTGASSVPVETICSSHQRETEGLKGHTTSSVTDSIATSSASFHQKPSTATSAPGGTSANLSVEDAVRLEEVRKLLQEAEAKAEVESTGSALKPFARDPEKQKRYEQFLVLQTANRKDDYRLLIPASHTSWEREREISEFTRAAALFRPLASSLAEKFVSAGTVEQERAGSGAERVREEDPSVAAARRKMFGVMTRKKEVWRPASLLCKRFNVKDPFPQTNLAGTVSGSAGPSRTPFLSILPPTLTTTTDVEPPTVASTSPAASTTPSTLIPPRARSKAGRLAWDWLIAEEDAANRDAVTSPGRQPQSTEHDMTADQNPASGDPAVASTPTPAKKPPPDLFKAIFDNSSSEESDDDDGKEEEAPVEVPSAATPEGKHGSAHITETSEKEEVSVMSQGASSMTSSNAETLQETSSLTSGSGPSRSADQPAASGRRPAAAAFFGNVPATAAAKKPGFSLFDGVDLDELNSWKRNTEIPARLADPPAASTVVSLSSSDDEYGPKLPPPPRGGSNAAATPKMPVPSKNVSAVVGSSDTESVGEKWREKSDSKRRSKKKKKHKKSERKRKKRRRSSTGSDSDSDAAAKKRTRHSDSNSEASDLDSSILEKLTTLSPKKKRKKSRH